jgi:ABC-type multidrug transport system fused ATPase/permease subunit
MEFFDTTPVGRIINRFSKDLESTERNIPESYKNVVRCLLVVLSSIAVISITTPLFLLSFIPLAIVYFFIQV